MAADVNVTEKVARAIEDALMQPTHAPMATHDPVSGDCQACPWPVHELPVPDMADALAPAALAALADPEVQAGIAGVVANFAIEVRIGRGWVVSSIGPEQGALITAAVVEWLRGRAL